MHRPTSSIGHFHKQRFSFSQFLFVVFLDYVWYFTELHWNKTSVFVQIYGFYPTFGRKLVCFCPNLWFLPHIWTKITITHCRISPYEQSLRDLDEEIKLIPLRYEPSQHGRGFLLHVSSRIDTHMIDINLGGPFFQGWQFTIQDEPFMTFAREQLDVFLVAQSVGGLAHIGLDKQAREQQTDVVEEISITLAQLYDAHMIAVGNV